MHSRYSFPSELSQNRQLPIRVVAPGFGHLSPAANQAPGLTQRLPYYFFLFMVNGRSRYVVDMDTYDVANDDLLFSLPHQIQQWPDAGHGNDYYKLGFDEACLSKLPRSYPFLLNPLNQQKIHFSRAAAVRLQAIFTILRGLLITPDTDPDLLLAHLNCLLTELNTAYFAGNKRLPDDRLTRFIDFKLFVEQHFTDHPSIREIATALALSTDSLYQLVKDHAGLSPKEFLTNRLILEARRRLYYGERLSVKELAYGLGFNDPDYFSRLFKKATGKTVAAFVQDLS